jgi:hypothetical protein
MTEQPLTDPDPLIPDPPAAPAGSSTGIVDPPPARRNRGGRPKGSRNKPRASRAANSTGEPKEPTVSQVDRKLIQNFTYLLAKPAEVSRGAGFAFGAAHFAETAQPTAQMIVKASHDWDELRQFLTNADKLVSGKVLLAGALLTYALPPVLALTGREAPAYFLSPVSPEQVAAIQLMMIDPVLQQRIFDLRDQGYSDDDIATIINTDATTSTNGQGSPTGQGVSGSPHPA